MAVGNIKKAIRQKLGKAQARERFAPLVESLAANGGVVEITDYGKASAVLLSYKDYMSLVSQASVSLKPSRQLRGSGILLGDLEETGKEISKLITGSLKKTIAEL
jgi:prevent-host-death family protein